MGEGDVGIFCRPVLEQEARAALEVWNGPVSHLGHGSNHIHPLHWLLARREKRKRRKDSGSVGICGQGRNGLRSVFCMAIGVSGCWGHCSPDRGQLRRNSLC